MNERKLFPSASSSKISATVLALAALLCASEAHALREAEPPSAWTDGVRVVIGTTPAGNGTKNTWVVYQDGISQGGSCHWVQIGGSGLWDTTRVHGTSAADEFRVVGAGQQVAFCGAVLGPVIAGAALEIYTWAGGDIAVAVGNAFPSMLIDLGSGSDFAVFDDIDLLYGRGGHDYVVGLAMSDVQIFLFEDNDTYCSYNGPAFALWGGTGTDLRWGSVGFHQEMEGSANKATCDFVLAAIDARFSD